MKSTIESLYGSSVSGKSVTKGIVRVTLAPDQYSTTYTSRDRITSIILPDDRISVGRRRVIRLHEMLHANQEHVASAARFKKVARRLGYPLEALGPAHNLIRDLAVHCVHWPKRGTLPGLDRDTQAVALHDLRNASASLNFLARTEPECAAHNTAVVVATRSLAILQEFGNRNLSNRVPQVLRDKALPIVERLKKRRGRFNEAHVELALRELLPLFRISDEARPDGKCAGNPFGWRLPGESRYGLQPYMAIYRPRLTVPTKRTGVDTVKDSVGDFDVGEYIEYLIGSADFAPFLNEAEDVPRGTVLIDGSGSMQAGTDVANELCAAIPGYTVGIYSSNQPHEAYPDCPAGLHGVLMIYAENGRRLPDINGWNWADNNVDLPALQWLIEQPHPWFFVTDLGFCGGEPGDDELAQHALGQLTDMGQVQVLPSLGEARDFFKSMA